MYIKTRNGSYWQSLDKITKCWTISYYVYEFTFSLTLLPRRGENPDCRDTSRLQMVTRWDCCLRTSYVRRKWFTLSAIPRVYFPTQPLGLEPKRLCRGAVPHTTWKEYERFVRRWRKLLRSCTSDKRHFLLLFFIYVQIRKPREMSFYCRLVN